MFNKAKGKRCGYRLIAPLIALLVVIRASRSASDFPACLVLSHQLQKLGLSIEFAKINTEGGRAAGVFYVAERSGGKVSDSGRLDEIKQRLVEAVTALGASTARGAEHDTMKNAK